MGVESVVRNILQQVGSALFLTIFFIIYPASHADERKKSDMILHAEKLPKNALQNVVAFGTVV